MVSDSTWSLDGNPLILCPSGYANEVGESFRPLVPKLFVNLSYGVAISYVLAECVDKSVRAFRVSCLMHSIFFEEIDFCSFAEARITWWRFEARFNNRWRCFPLANAGFGCHSWICDQSTHLGRGKIDEIRENQGTAWKMDSNLHRIGIHSVHHSSH